MVMLRHIGIPANYIIMLWCYEIYNNDYVTNMAVFIREETFPINQLHGGTRHPKRLLCKAGPGETLNSEGFMSGFVGIGAPIPT